MPLLREGSTPNSKGSKTLNVTVLYDNLVPVLSEMGSSQLPRLKLLTVPEPVDSGRVVRVGLVLALQLDRVVQDDVHHLEASGDNRRGELDIDCRGQGEVRHLDRRYLDN